MERPLSGGTFHEIADTRNSYERGGIMAKTIKSILKKKSWTGKEVGYALLLSLANDIENTGNPNKKIILSQEDYERMVNSLSDGKEYEDYRVYSKIYNAVVNSTDYRQAMEQQFFNGYYRYFLALEMAQRAEEFLQTAEELPLILSKPQYDKVAAECEARKKAATESYYSLFFHTVAFFVDAVEDGRADNVPKDIRAAILETKSQPVANERILANWAEDMGEGYYTLPDGRRSDQMTSKEWSAALEADFVEKHKYYVDGELQDYSTTAKHYRQEGLLKACELLYKGGEAIKEAYEEKTGKTLPEKYISGVEKALEEIIDGEEEGKDTTEEQIAKILFCDELDGCQEWHFYTEPPETLTKYDILTEKETLGRYSGSYSTRLSESSGKRVKEIQEREQLREFKKDYPALADAVKEYLKKTLQAVQGLKASQYYSPLITWGELAEMGFLDFQTLTAATDQDIIDHLAGMQEETSEGISRQISGKRHGIAVLTDTTNSKNYMDPIAERVEKDAFYSLDYLILDQKKADYTQLIYERLIIPALRYIYAFDSFIDVLAGVYDVDFLKIAKFNEELIEWQIESFNNLIYLLYKVVFGTPKDKKRKRDFLRWYFPPIEIKNFKPPRDALDRLATMLEGFTSEEAADALGDYKVIISKLIELGG